MMGCVCVRLDERGGGEVRGGGFGGGMERVENVVSLRE